MLTSDAGAEDILSGSNEKKGLDVDRWIFVFMAVFFFVTVLVGFIPDSIAKVNAIQSGLRAPFPVELHIHAILMGSWIMLLLTQTSLVAGNNRALHQKLGLAALFLAPAMVVSGIALVLVIFQSVWALDTSVVPAQEISTAKTAISNIALGQIRTGFLFPLFIGLALYYRKKEPGIHKRLMFLATVLAMPAAFDRIAWLPKSLPESPATWEIYIVLWMLPLFIYDLLRSGRVHRAYIIFISGFLPFAIATNVLWGSPWWLATVPKIMGVESW